MSKLNYEREALKRFANAVVPNTEINDLYIFPRRQHVKNMEDLQTSLFNKCR